MKTIIRSAKGTARRTIDVDDIQVPNLWHVGMYLKKKGWLKESKEILDTWYLAHDLLDNVKADEAGEQL